MRGTRAAAAAAFARGKFGGAAMFRACRAQARPPWPRPRARARRARPPWSPQPAARHALPPKPRAVAALLCSQRQTATSDRLTCSRRRAQGGGRDASHGGRRCAPQYAGDVGHRHWPAAHRTRRQRGPKESHVGERAQDLTCELCQSSGARCLSMHMICLWGWCVCTAACGSLWAQ